MAEEEVTMLRPGEQLRGRWDVKKKLGGGGFGQIFIAYDTRLKLNVAIKCEAKVANDPNHIEVLSMEQKVLKSLEGKAHFCSVYGSGADPTYNFLVMTLCGPNLTDLRHETPMQYFSFGTAAHLTMQTIESVQLLHGIGYLHRDIKPSNFAMGRDQIDARMVYMVDFGLARQYIKMVDGQAVIRAKRERVGFRGTVRYASIVIHQNQEMGRVDDLWSVYYMFIEMAVGKLPWRMETDKNKVLDIKKSIPHMELARGMPPSIGDLVRHLEQLDYADQPNYNYLMDRLRNAMRIAGLNTTDPFDWENQYQNCRQPCPFQPARGPGGPPGR